MNNLVIHNNLPPSVMIEKNEEDIAMAKLFLERRDVDGDIVLSRSTVDSYLKEYRRLLIFCSGRGQTFKDFTFEDTQEYIKFIKAPPSHLISDKKLPVSHKDWTPFFKPLSGASIRQAIAPLKSLWAFFQETGYLQLNPWALLTTKTNKVRAESAKRKLRVIPTDLIRSALTYLSEAEPTAKLNRQRWLFVMYLYTGSRLSDLINHKTDSFELASSKGKSFWVFNHTSKGGVFHSITAPKVLIEELKLYRASLDKVQFPALAEPLVFTLTGKSRVRHRDTIHKEMKDLFSKIAFSIAATKGSEYSQVFLKASTHWLKHSFVSIALDVSDGDIRRVTDLARHADWKTTKAYDNSELGPLSDISEKIAATLLK